MKISLYNAISIDGFIAEKNDNTDWVCDTDWKEFSRVIKAKKAIIMGRKTFEHTGEDFPYDCELNIVLTKNDDLIDKMKDAENSWFTNLSPKEIITELEKRGFEECLLIGGGNCNAAFLEANLIDEIILSIHPIILGNGIRLFESENVNIELEKISVREMEEGLTQIVYKFIK